MAPSVAAGDGDVGLWARIGARCPLGSSMVEVLDTSSDSMLDTVSKPRYPLAAMMSIDVRFAPIERICPGEAARSPGGIVPTFIRAAEVERLSWTRDLRDVGPPAPGAVDSSPVARSRSTTMHVATDSAGFPCLVRRCARVGTDDFAAGHRLGSAHLAGVSVPELVARDGADLWMDRWPWESVGCVDGASVDRYITSSLRSTLRSGVLVGTGTVHRTAGGLVCEDVVVACRLEPDQRELLRSIVLALAALDPTRVADAVAELCRLRPARLTRAARAATRSLEARWTAVAFGLAVHGLGRSVLTAGTRAEPLVLLGDELLHRLDLAHEHRVDVPGLADPQNVVDLASPRRPEGDQQS